MLTREFIDSLLARCLPIPESGCLIWEGRISDCYGYIWLNGHPFTSENLGTPCKSSGHIRVCKKCAVIRQTSYRARKVEYATLL